MLYMEIITTISPTFKKIFSIVVIFKTKHFVSEATQDPIHLKIDIPHTQTVRNFISIVKFIRGCCCCCSSRVIYDDVPCYVLVNCSFIYLI
jgi:hypothetical protein